VGTKECGSRLTKQLRYLLTLPKLTPGGTERTAATFANFLAAKGKDVTILLMTNEQVFFPLHPEVKLVAPARRKFSARLLQALFVLHFLRKQIRKRNPSVILALGYISYTLISTIGLSIPVVISPRSSPFRVRFPDNKLLDIGYRITKKCLSPGVKGVIAQTSVAADSLKRQYSCPVVVIPNFLRTLANYKLSRQNQILSVGRYSAEKGQKYLIEAFAGIKAPDWRLVLVGDGPERENLQNLIHKLNLQTRVKLAGFQKDVDDYYSQSKIFALTSTIEGFPNALLEAMATPLAVVSFDCMAGPADIIDDNVNGLLVEDGNVKQLTEKLHYLINNEDVMKRLMREAVKVRDKYSLNKIGEAYLNFMNRVCAVSP